MGKSFNMLIYGTSSEMIAGTIHVVDTAIISLEVPYISILNVTGLPANMKIGRASC